MLLALGLVVSFGFLCCCSGFGFATVGCCLVFDVCYLLFDVVVIGGVWWLFGVVFGGALCSWVSVCLKFGGLIVLF